MTTRKRNRDCELRARIKYNATPRAKLCRKRHECALKGIHFDLNIQFYQSTPDTCPQCGNCFGSGQSNLPSVDRVDPCGGYTMKNVEWICGKCNERKRDMTYAEMLEFAMRGLARHRVEES